MGSKENCSALAVLVGEQYRKENCSNLKTKRGNRFGNQKQGNEFLRAAKNRAKQNAEGQKLKRGVGDEDRKKSSARFVLNIKKRFREKGSRTMSTDEAFLRQRRKGPLQKEGKEGETPEGKHRIQSPGIKSKGRRRWKIHEG